jgi:hypothetical protein
MVMVIYVIPIFLFTFYAEWECEQRLPAFAHLVGVAPRVHRLEMGWLVPLASFTRSDHTMDRPRWFCGRVSNWRYSDCTDNRRSAEPPLALFHAPFFIVIIATSPSHPSFKYLGWLSEQRRVSLIVAAGTH